LGNPHLQTLLAFFLPGPAFGHPTRTHVLHLPDGDGMVLHDSVPESWLAGGPIAVLVHGLTGSHASPQISRLALALVDHGHRVVRLDLRGCGLGLPLARGFYHGGCSDDVRAALREVHQWSPASPITLVGVSLGGNIVLKLAGEMAEHTVPGLDRVAALAPPIDLEACVRLLDRPSNRMYEQFFVRELVAAAQRRQRCFPDLPPLRLPRRLTMRIFDDLYTAPRRGFADSLDYYRRASAHPLIPRIQVPAFLMAAADDPFIAIEPFRSLQAPAHVEVRLLRRGGHLGFLGWDGHGGIRWAERRLLEWVARGGERLRAATLPEPLACGESAS
jgi:predicted alpha/beta-fold hydrolase